MVLIFTNPDLLPEQTARGETIVLEGSPPSRAGTVRSLDESIDGRYAWIDGDAQRIAESLGGSCASWDTARLDYDARTAAYLHARRLRYALVKLLRTIVYFTDIRPLLAKERLALHVCAGRDDDYVAVFRGLCRTSGSRLEVHYAGHAAKESDPPPPNPAWRRALGCLLASRRRGGGSRTRVILCGNARLLDPVCGALLARKCRVWWLYDRFAPGTWLRRRRDGVKVLACDSSLGRRNPFFVEIDRPVVYRGVDLAKAVQAWLSSTVDENGAADARLIRRIDSHFERIRPDYLLVDEDATPIPRAAIALARGRGMGSGVVQHGVTCVRFGFAPPAADRFFAWGEASRRQLIDWGYPPDRIVVTGAAQQGKAQSRVESAKRPERVSGKPRRILLLGTVPPRANRPDAVGLHYTAETYRRMLEAALGAVARFGDIHLTVKPHPRALDDPILHECLAGLVGLDARVVTDLPPEALFPSHDVVISCFSSAGVEALLYGVPVIQLVPQGSEGVLPYRRWGLAAEARTARELDAELGRILDAPVSVRQSPAAAFAATGEAAASAIADAVLRRNQTPSASAKQRTLTKAA